jgi:CBS domain-containing protein
MPSVKDLMTQNVIKIDMHKTIFDAAILMTEKKVGCLIIMEGEKPVGIITERDFVRRVVAINCSLDTSVSKIMSQPLIIIEPNATLKTAARLMLKNKIRRLPVVENNKLVGMIVVADFARQLSKKTITEEILNAMARYPVHMFDETMGVVGAVVDKVYTE